MRHPSRSPARSRHPSALNDNVLWHGRQRHSPQTHQRTQLILGLEMLDHLGIDIDQDPRAFAKFLELKNQLG
jgi:hypothetical protein